MKNITSHSEMVTFMCDVLEKMEDDIPVANVISKMYKSIEEKLPKDMKNLMPQYTLLFGMMMEEAEEDEEFAKQLLLPYKTWIRLYKYMDGKARPTSEEDKNFRPRCAAVDSFTLLEWIKEYYALDDQEDYEKELQEKEETERKKKENEEKIKQLREKAAKAKKDKSSKTVSKTIIDVEADREEKTEDDNSSEEIQEEKVIIKNSKRDCTGQLDLFGWVNEAIE